MLPPRTSRYIRFPTCSWAGTRQPAHHLVDNRPVVHAGLNGTSTVTASPGRKRASFHLRINPSPARKRYIMAKKPATESTRAQGWPECLNPSATALKPPSRLEQASSWVINPNSYSGSWVGFLISWVEKCQNPPLPSSRFTVGQERGPFSNRQFLPKSQKPLASLVSFPTFAQTHIPAQKVVISSQPSTPTNSETGEH